MNELEALNLAIEREKGAHRLYSKAATSSTDAKAKEMFSWLASEEMGHLNILEKQRDSVKGSGKWLSQEKWASGGEISMPIDRSEFPSLSEVKGSLKTDAPELQVLKEAIDGEKESASFYADITEATSDPNGMAMLKKLSEVERGHHLEL